jgi:hypothetical protein
MLKQIELYLNFFKNFAFLSLIINSISTKLFLTYGFSIFIGIFWFKTISLALTFYFVNEYKAKQYFYYYNFGISRLKLWGVCIFFDLMLLTCFLIIANTFR